MHAKAVDIPADEIVFDLEDAVAPGAKAQARETIAATLAEPHWAGRTVAVRVNAPGTSHLEADIEWFSGLRTDAALTVVIPKVEAPEQVVHIAAALGGETGLQALLETPAGIGAAAAIAAASPLLRSLILGYADLATALGRRGAEREVETWLVQQEAVLGAARANGLQAIDGPFLRLGAQSALERATRAVRELGFDGKWAIHPEQVATLNSVFAATDDEVRWGTAVQEALAEAAESGDAAVRVDGAMVDEAMRAHAQRLLALPRDTPTSPPPAPAPAPSPGAAHTRPVTAVGPPRYEDLAVGQVFGAPGLTITDAHQALHQAIIGDRLRLSLDAPLCREVTGAATALAHPMLVCDIAIGQSTEPSGRVLGNLFYRGLAARPIHIGTTLRTRTEVVAKRRTKPVPGRGARGMVVLHVTASDAEGSVVLDYHRCPMLPAHGEDPDEVGDDLNAAASRAGERDVHELVPVTWDLEPLRRTALGPLFADLQAGTTWELANGETVTGATELARLSLNLAMTHTDASAGAHGQRLVYGGHVIGIAAAHLVRVLPDLATVLSWRSCDHLGPTFEGDLLHSTITLEDAEPLADGGLLHVQILVSAQSGDGDPRPVLDWRLVALMP